MATKVEYGSTAFLQFETKLYNPNNGTTSNIDPDTYEAQLETTDLVPIVPLRVDKIDVGKFIVYATAKRPYMDVGQAYYVALYWTYGGIEMAEREMVIVVPDIPKT